jgi:Holliday junction resolvase RusA-like endonuclease
MSDNEFNKSNRVKISFGACHINQPQIKLESNSNEASDYQIDYERYFYLFDVIPMGAVRMTQSDRWKLNPNHKDPLKRQREVVTRYFEFKDKIKAQSTEMKFKLSGVLEIVFLVPMPFTWSEKKKVKHNKQPVKTRPDIDNYVKAFMDALEFEDGFVWKIIAEKRYAFKGSILVYENYII